MSIENLALHAGDFAKNLTLLSHLVPIILFRYISLSAIHNEETNAQKLSAHFHSILRTHLKQ